jgi:hypothetical protein
VVDHGHPTFLVQGYHDDFGYVEVLLGAVPLHLERNLGGVLGADVAENQQPAAERASPAGKVEDVHVNDIVAGRVLDVDGVMLSISRIALG